MQPSVAEFYHEATKYTPEGLATHRPKIDWAHPPLPFKPYTTGKRVDLAQYLPFAELERSEDVQEEWEALTFEERAMADLSHLLYFSNGVTAVIPYPEREFLMRAAPSAGGLYPTEVYVAARGYPGLPDGLYNYQVRQHELIGFWEGDVHPRLAELSFDHPAIAASDLIMILTGVFFRSSWRYQDRAYRRILLDSGHVWGNSAMMAPFFGREAFPIGGFHDNALEDLLFLERHVESGLMLLALPRKEHVTPALREAPAALPSTVRRESRPAPEGERLWALHDSARISTAPTPAEPPAPTPSRPSFGFAESLEAPPVSWNEALGDTIVLRRSTRSYSGRAISREQLAQVLDFAYRPDGATDPRIATPPNLLAPELLQTYVAVNAVEGLDPGCYHYDPARRELRQVRFTGLAMEIEYLCLGQELGGKAAAVVFHTTNLPRAVSRYGERAYRYVHLDAGHLGERLSIAAMRLGLGASGIGGFFDDRVNDLLGIPAEEATVYLTTIGQPSAV
ncbi:Nitroreductase family protein [compost metagenome]